MRGRGEGGAVPWMSNYAAFPALARHPRERILVGVVKQIRPSRHAELRVFLVVKPVLVQDRYGQIVPHYLELFVEKPV